MPIRHPQRRHRRRTVGVKQAACVGRLVEIIAQPVMQFLGQKFEALFRGDNLRVEILKILFQRSGLQPKVIQLALRIRAGSSPALEKRRERTVAVPRAGRCLLQLGLHARQFRAQ